MQSVQRDTIRRNSQCRVFIIEAQNLLAKALCVIFATDPHLSVVSDSRHFDEAAFRAADPDVVLIDCDDDLTALDRAVARCRKAVSGAKICVLSGQLVPEVMMRALNAGADGFAVKDLSPDELMGCVKSIWMKGFYVDARLAFALLKDRDKAATQLTSRELDVTRLIAQGLSNREISKRLALSDKTVKNHVANIFSKVHVTARTQLAIYAIRTGIV